MQAKLDTGGKWILWALSLSFVAVIVATGYLFLYQRDYQFYTEGACDPASQSCFVRDCSEADACPPNNLESYRVFYVKARDFGQCESDGSCLSACTTDKISCEEVMCGDDEVDECSQ